MDSSNCISVVFIDQEPQSINMLPTFEGLREKIVEINKDILSDSLRSLIVDISQIIEKSTNDKDFSNGIQLKEVEISAQLSVDGGLQWIASASTGITNAMTLRFAVKSRK